MSDQKYPLNWPAGWRRTVSRTEAKFVGKQAVYGVEGSPNKPRERVSIAQGVARLVKQLNMLDGAALTISSNLVLNQDGSIRRDQRAPADPGVAVYWKTRRGEPRCMAIDQYTRIADNLAAIAATLEAMRAIRPLRRRGHHGARFHGLQSTNGPGAVVDDPGMHTGRQPPGD